LRLGIAVSLAAVALFWRRLRWALLAASAAAAGWAVPHLDLLVARAYPTSFYRSPTGFTAAAIERGAALYPEHCSACHGSDRRGDGPNAKSLRRRVNLGPPLLPTIRAPSRGGDGRGDAPTARSLPIPPADLTAEHLWN